MLNRHSKIKTLLSSYVDGELNAGEARRVEDHIATCSECREEIESIRMTVELVRVLPEIALPRSFELPSLPEAAPRFGLGVWAPRLATSAVGLVLVVLLAGDATGVLTQSGSADDFAADALTQGAAVTQAESLEAPAASQAAAAAAPPMAADAAPKAAEATPEAAPSIGMRAAAAPPAPAQADAADDLATPAPATAIQDDGAAAVLEAEEPVSDAEDDGVGLPLRELQIAGVALFAALAAATIWLARRRGRLQV